MRPPLEIGADRFPRAGRERIEAIVRDAVPRVAPTLALSVWQRGRPTLDVRAGWMDPERRERPTRPDALFDLASITKTVTATSFLQAVNADRVRLDDPVVSVIPELGDGGLRPVDGGQEALTRRVLPTPSERAGWRVDPVEVTFRQLLIHTSGLAPWRAVFEACGPAPAEPEGVDPVASTERHAAGLRAVVGYPFVDRVGRAFHYSDLGFMLLGESIQRLIGRSLDDVLRSGVAEPFGLTGLGYRPMDAGIDRDRIVPTSVDALWRLRRCWGEVEDENCAGMGGIAGHAGLFATAEDVARFGQAWLDGANSLGIDASVAAEATTDQTSALEVTRGLGWQLRGDRPDDEDAGHLAPLGPGAFGHTGFTGTSLAIDPSRQLVLVLLTNRVHASRTHTGVDELRRDLHQAVAGIVGPG